MMNSCAMLTSNNKFAWTPGVCKEYCLDYTRDAILGIRSAYRNCKTEVHLGEVRFYIDIDNLINALEYVNLVEEVIGIAPSVIKSARGFAFFAGSARWLLAPPMLSFYTLLIRSGRRHVLGSPLEQTMEMYSKIHDMYSPYYVDASIYQYGQKGIDVLLAHPPEAVFGTDLKSNWNFVNGIHDCGISNFASRFYIERLRPRWYDLFPRK